MERKRKPELSRAPRMSLRFIRAALDARLYLGWLCSAKNGNWLHQQPFLPTGSAANATLMILQDYSYLSSLKPRGVVSQLNFGRGCRINGAFALVRLDLRVLPDCCTAAKQYCEPEPAFACPFEAAGNFRNVP
jgi:hypothetical protein